LIHISAAFFVAGFFVLARPLAAEPVRGLGEWKFEVLHHKNSKTYQGLVKVETTKEIGFWEVKQQLGEASRRMYHVFNRGDVLRIDRLDAKEREILWTRIQAINPVAKAKEERDWLEQLDLETVAWERGRKQGWSYTSVHFVLRSNAREDIVRRAALRLEQIYAAYARFLPPRSSLTTSAASTTILLVDSLAEYQAVNDRRGRKILNPAVYDPKRNEIVCGSEFQRLGADLEKVRKLEEEWKKQVAALKKRYKGKLPAAIKAQVERDSQEIKNINKDNDKVFETASLRLFRTLFHEAFHAYLENFVFPRKHASVPVWLNEGLAQLFETAIVEAGELRVGHVDKFRLPQLAALVKKEDLVPLGQLLKAGPKEFHVVHASHHLLADRYYLTSWALAFYLTVDQKLLTDRKRLDDYVSSSKKGADPAAAFEKLVGKPLAAFEKEFGAFVDRLVKTAPK
jgi:hypothetical protein